MQAVPITTKVVSLNPAHGEVYLIQHYVIKLVNDLGQVGGFLWVVQIPPPIKLFSKWVDRITFTNILSPRLKRPTNYGSRVLFLF
jgi:hypothetical protein